MQMFLAYLGPGIGIGGLILVIGLGVAMLFLFYAFIYLPFKQSFCKKSSKPND